MSLQKLYSYLEMEAKDSLAIDAWKMKSVSTEITQNFSVRLSESAYTPEAEYITN